MSSVVVVETRPPRSASRAALVVGGTVVAAAVIWFILAITATPDTVPRITVVNDSAVDVEVAVAPASGAGVVDLGPIAARSTRSIRDVIDQGDRWVFVVETTRDRLGAVAVDRDRLVRDGWTVHLRSDLPGTPGDAAS
jgi:hypothetical protein